MCWKPSQRSGDDTGGDIVCCDSNTGSLFHKKYVNYNDKAAVKMENWLCPACDTLVDDDDIGLEQVESRPISGNNVEALLKVVKLSFNKVPLKSFVRGFETRRVFIKKVLDSNGDNNYEMHW
jgi:hypothetical protein